SSCRHPDLPSFPTRRSSDLFGITMIAFHGLPKLMGGPELWTAIGGSMQNLGINFLPTAFGFSAGLIETLGSLLLILGLWTRPARSEEHTSELQSREKLVCRL